MPRKNSVKNDRGKSTQDVDCSAALADAFSGVSVFGLAIFRQAPENASAKADPTGHFQNRYSEDLRAVGSRQDPSEYLSMTVRRRASNVRNAKRSQHDRDCRVTKTVTL